MTREEQIIEFAEKQTLDVFGELDDFTDFTDGIILGAKWADKTMIDKACEIAKDILSSYSFANYPHEMQDFLRSCCNRAVNILLDVMKTSDLFKDKNEIEHERNEPFS